MDLSPKQQRTIMLVEDCEIDREIYCRCLRSDTKYEYSYLVAESKEEALAVYSNHRDQIDLILLDYFLANTSGLEILSLWQQQYGKYLCPIIALTEMRNEEIVVQFLKLGAINYLVKDRLTSTQLRLAIDNAIATQKTKVQLLARENFFRNTFELAAVGIARVGVDGKWLQVNPKLCEILGYSSDKLLQKTFQDITHPEDLATDLEYIRQLQAREIDHCHFEKRYFHRQGRTVWAWVRVSAIRYKSGKIDYFIAAIEDISDRKQAELNLQDSKRKLEQANSAKDIFIAQMSHEFRTPLNSLIGFSELLQSDPNMTAEQQRYVRLIDRSGRHLLSLVNQVLDISAIEAGKLGLVLEEFDLVSFLENIAEIFYILSQEKELNLNLDLDTALPVVIKTDKTKLQQILINLLNNAVKYTERGEIDFNIVVIENIGQHQIIQFKIIDTGVGIPSEQLAEVFNPFQQLNVHCQSSQGTGLGLTITENLLRLLDSNIQLSSEVNKGSQFWFDLKVEKVDSTRSIDTIDSRFDDVPKAVKIGSAISPNPLDTSHKVLPQIELNNIAELLKYGDIEAISQQLERLKILEPECQEFIQQAQNLVDNFELKKLEKLIDNNL